MPYSDNRDFLPRHIGPNADEQLHMLAALGYDDMDAFINDLIPDSIRQARPLALDEPMSEATALASLQAIASGNKLYKSFIGQGYYNCHTPAVIRRNLFENPSWYTAYTPYQPEISQGRLEALLNYQTMVCDLTGLDIANASLLDEGSAAAEAMALCRRMSKSKSNVFYVDDNCLPQTLEVLKTRAEPAGYQLVVGIPANAASMDCFGILLQYPGANGEITDFTDLISTMHEKGTLVTVAADLLALLLLKSPGAMGADVAVGSSQRFGVPVGFGGPHAAYMACQDDFKRSLPGRLLGVSKDVRQPPTAWPTDTNSISAVKKATSNICTAQVPAAVIARMYAVYHEARELEKGCSAILHHLTCMLSERLKAEGVKVVNSCFFDT